MKTFAERLDEIFAEMGCTCIICRAHRAANGTGPRQPFDIELTATEVTESASCKLISGPSS